MITYDGDADDDGVDDEDDDDDGDADHHLYVCSSSCQKNRFSGILSVAALLWLPSGQFQRHTARG